MRTVLILSRFSLLIMFLAGLMPLIMCLHLNTWHCLFPDYVRRLIKPIMLVKTSPPTPLEANQAQLGGYGKKVLTMRELRPYLPPILCEASNGTLFRYLCHTRDLDKYKMPNYISLSIPLIHLVDILPVLAIVRDIATMHGISAGSRASYKLLATVMASHDCSLCSSYKSVFLIENQTYDIGSKRRAQVKIRSSNFRSKILLEPSRALSIREANRLRAMKSRKKKDLQCNGAVVAPHLEEMFPPAPLTAELAHAIITKACDKMSNPQVEETGCAICGQLTLRSQLVPRKKLKEFFNLLCSPGVSRQQRARHSDKIKDYPFVIDHSCKYACVSCYAILKKGKVPRCALAKGLWIGPVPDELKRLSFVEKLLVARVRHSCCSIRIASGMRKMKANAISFRSPIPKIYDILPPPQKDMDEVLAIMFTGPSCPTASDFLRTPFLVRRNYVKIALDWLMLNHADYADVKFSQANLDSYAESVPPVTVQYSHRTSNKTPEGMSMHDLEDEEGTENGACPFTVHGIVGQDLETLTTNAIKAKALQHLNMGGNFLAVGHSPDPESIWNNPQLYPQMFPWLFPYGLGGIGSVEKLSHKEHKRRLLMYHDKRFQTDPNFPFIAFSHEQISTATTNSFLLAEKKIFGDISQRILNLNTTAFNDLLYRLGNEENVTPETETEKNCFKLLKDLDHVAGTVKGSTTSKKWMRNEIWSLIAHCGAPFWYITLSPADVKHPICIYYAGSDEKFEPSILPYDERMRKVCSNPVACARFFHFIVTIFISDVLGMDSNLPGLYGTTKAYYGTVEQQGRLALHLHALIWLLGNLTPLEMRNLILDPNGTFQQKIIKWIDSCQMGEFLTGTHGDVKERLMTLSTMSTYKDPTETLPETPPQLCGNSCQKCEKCTRLQSWWSRFKDTVDDILCKSNIHNCERGITKSGKQNKMAEYTRCRDNKYGICKARFPRTTIDATHVDPETGSLNLKKKEPWMNAVTSHLTYIFRCNTDVTSLWSGTALKAVIVYISEYITKSSLKTHVMFDAIRSVFEKNTDLISGTLPNNEKARILLNKMVNLLSTKAELGGPMVCMYLLDQPDHYTSHKFVPFYWRSFVNECTKPWLSAPDEDIKEKLMILKVKNKIVSFSPVYDYIYRAKELENFCVYDWVRRCTRKRFNSALLHGNRTDENTDSDDTSDTDESDWSNQPQHSAVPKKIPPNIHLFQNPHPLCKSHASCLGPEDEKLVVNFIGGILPRHVPDDNDEYCLTMLTLFKPWRSGLDLKAKDEQWTDAFSIHNFTERQNEIMKNLNIRYECMDARDDYRSQMKAKGGDLRSEYFTANNWDSEDNLPQIELPDNEIENHLNWTDLKSGMEVGPKEAKLKLERSQMRNVLTDTGWLHVLPTSPGKCVAKSIVPAISLSGCQWRTILQQERQSVLERRQSRTHIAYQCPTDAEYAKCHTTDSVKIVDKRYLQKKYYVTQFETSIKYTNQKYELNTEQSRAFGIIAHHAVFPSSDQMLMYIGGMAGTGKTQVLKALTFFFKERDESFRLTSVAPTGSAAALLAGSTYHSVFGIHEQNGITLAKLLSQVRARLDGVDYIFLDEVSMLSCHDMYKISAQLARVRNIHDKPFGGMNFIFAGDFAQLPPPIGGENVALYSRHIGRYRNSVRQQEESMGLAVWHQVTDVVILRKNMRQKGMTTDDRKLRQALENMRYKNCTADDIEFLRTRITSVMPGRPNICDKEFRDVAIITAKNSQKDEINRLGCIRFALETNQELLHFFSEDSCKGSNTFASQLPQQNGIPCNMLPNDLQDILWNIPHSCSDKPIAGRLSICMDMPVIIKCNAATELGVTNGQEGYVAGWKSASGSKGQAILETIFILLHNPPCEVTIKGLPKNTIPLTRTSNTISCKLPDDSKVVINRSQVEILPNFAMTDYASQGKTRAINPVDLINCRSHQAYYTALSRSASADGTVILRGFNANKITGRASQALRQEFRDLEFLDEISKLRFNDKLPSNVTGHTRTALIRAYRSYRGLSLDICTGKPAGVGRPTRTRTRIRVIPAKARVHPLNG